MDVPGRIGSYRIVELLGRGGFAVVYAAEDERDGARVAVKIPTAAGTVHAAWLRREASLAARLRHPGIVRLVASGMLERDSDSVPYLVFERIDGPTLETIADQLDAGSIVAVGAQLLEALGYAHDAGVVHCDIKPDNVLVEGRDPATGYPRVRLADFGLAATRLPSGQEASSLPLVAGTPGYLSPEQARGWGRLGPASDLYATGALLHRLVAGVAPHVGGSSSEVMRRTLWGPPTTLEPRRGLAVPPELLAAIEHMMAREPAARPASAYRARRELLEAGVRPSTVRADPLDATADTIPPPPPGSGRFARPAGTSSARRPAATPAVAISRQIGRRAPLIGRAREVGALVAACADDVQRAERSIVRILGPCGAGRTRVLRELVSTMRASGTRIFHVTGRRGVRSPPFEVLSGLALDVAGASGVSPAWVAAERLSAVLDQAGVPREDAGRDALIAGLVGVGLPTAVGTVRQQAYRAFRSLLHAESTMAGVLLCVDDADQMDEDSLAVLELLARTPDASDEAQQADGGNPRITTQPGAGGSHGAPRVVLVMTDAIEPTDASVRYADVELGPLAHEASVQMLAALTDGSSAPSSELDRAAEDARGMPADLTEAAAAIVARVATDGPVVERRVRSLSKRLRTVLAAAAIHGGDAPTRSLPSIAVTLEPELDEASARSAVDRLLLDGFLTRVTNPAASIEPSLRFASERTRRHVLASLDDAALRSLHGATVSWIVRASYDASLGVQAVLARHAEEAGDLATAAHAYATAGRLGNAASRPEASAHLAMALTLARSSPDAAAAVDEPALLADLAALALQRGEAETAELFAVQALALVEDERRTLRARLHRHVAEAHNLQRRFDPAMAQLDRAIALLGDHGDPTELATVLVMKGWSLAYLDGRVEAGMALGERAHEVASRIDAPEFRARLCGRLGGIFLRAGRWDDQLAVNLEDLGLSASSRDVGGVIRAHINLGNCYTNRGFTALARAHTERALELARRYGQVAAEQVAMNNLGLVAADERRFGDAERWARAALVLADRSGLVGAFGETWCTLARVALARGDMESAESAVEHVLAGGDSAVDHEMATRIEAMTHIRRGRPDTAVELLREHVTTKDPDPYERASTRLVLATALRAMGIGSEADAEEADADAVYVRLGADAAHERVKWQSIEPVTR